jgi:hypothetical protein
MPVAHPAQISAGGFAHAQGPSQGHRAADTVSIDIWREGREQPNNIFLASARAHCRDSTSGKTSLRIFQYFCSKYLSPKNFWKLQVF